MAIASEIKFENPINVSLQIGDTIYVSNILSGGTISPPIYAGKVLKVGSRSIVINKDPEDFPEITITPPQFTYISFAKPIQANESSLKGYYADVTLKNSSNTKTELFAISSEVVPSSK